VDGGEQHIARHRLLQPDEIVELARLADIGYELVEIPPLGHPVEDLFHLFLRLGHVVGRDGQH